MRLQMVFSLALVPINLPWPLDLLPDPHHYQLTVAS